jgi:hypothetical protein
MACIWIVLNIFHLIEIVDEFKIRSFQVLNLVIFHLALFV